MIRTSRASAVLLFLFFTLGNLSAYQISLHGGPILDIPEAWELSDGDPSIPSWYSPDRAAAAEVMLWAPGSWEDLQEFVDNVRPEGAEGDVAAFSCWDGRVALADWTFPTSSGTVRGWFLMVIGSGPDVRISAIAGEEDFEAMQPFLLSVIDSYAPSEYWLRTPGAMGRFLELTGEEGEEAVSVPLEGQRLTWTRSPAADMAAQDVIEREAVVLSYYGNTPQLFYSAWERYYKMIYRDSYSRLEPLAEALKSGPLPPGVTSGKEAAETLLSWFQGFTYGSTDGFSDLLAPSAACAAGVGDCDSLGLALLILMDGYGVGGRLLLSQRAKHALAALDVPGEGLRYGEGDSTWLVAEMTSRYPLGSLPDRLNGIDDWFGIALSEVDLTENE